MSDFLIPIGLGIGMVAALGLGFVIGLACLGAFKK